MIETLTLPQQDHLIDTHRPRSFAASSGGHMAYRRMLFTDANSDEYFVKAHDPSLLDEDWRRIEMQTYLEKESIVYEHLHKHQFAHIPEHATFNHDMLVLSGLTKHGGWHWRAPSNPSMYSQYVSDITSSLDALESVPNTPNGKVDEVSIDIFYDNGWGKLTPQSAEQIVCSGLAKWSRLIRPESASSARELLANFDALSLDKEEVQPSVTNHHDARQANIAWHPEHGAKLVDWSWADTGLIGGDKTMFLMDLHKSGHHIDDYIEAINPTYAKLMLGYWLQRSNTEHMEGNQEVRIQQFISAVSASEILLKHY